jgi:YVTN family beta-propeller protein
VTPDGTRAYAVSASGVSVIDTATNTVIGAPIQVGTFIPLLIGIAITPNGSSVYVANNGSGTVSVIATASNTVVDTIPVGTNPSGIAITPDGTHAYVVDSNVGAANGAASNVFVIDIATNTVVHTIPVGSYPVGIAITPDGTHAYVANAGSGSISVIDIATNSVVSTIPVLGVSGPVAATITPDGTHVYVLNIAAQPPDQSQSVSVIATASNTVVGSPIPVGPRPPNTGLMGLAVTPDGTGVYVANGGINTLSVISTLSNTVTSSVTVGNNPVAIAFPPPPSVPSSGTACNGFYNGTFKGNITVSKGQNCQFVTGGVTGNVLVTGGNFAFANGLIGGSVGIAGASTFSLGPGTIIDGSLGIGLIAPGTTTDQVCGVKVLHDFGVVGDASPLQIGSTSPAFCAGNTISGNATVDVNTGAIALYDNSITGTLSCLANKSITGAGNTATSKVGQCKAF